jgi:hypothetical protein
MKLDDLVGAYIKARDRKDAIKAEYAAKTADLDKLMTKIEGHLLKQFQETGVESCRTEMGTAYQTERTSATVASWEDLFPFIQKEEMWQFIERRVNKTAVEQYRAANDGELPPGVNWRVERVVNIRRSN